MKLVLQEDLPLQEVSHDPDIKKKVFLNKGDIPHLMMFSTATFTPGQSVETHKHDTMTEVFYIQKGMAEFTVEGKKYILKQGHCITIEAGEWHSQKNPFDADVTWLYFGVDVG
ncbi:cupin domain-containing protein [Croceivirga sp. JEA036]|uniref:cupin domain-containing protein n=1 Tax=Croceivirga sp. JEA036 TaxID=2721162 RepID=UPI001439E172|nr:cupin domain-containing protein [Croceivirga sp. JEA036]NJB37142.1 cupin domain-containing protein [Croceivirga sp. JEA036]